jgi:amidase
MTDIDCYSSARVMAKAVADKEISARELMDLHLTRIAEVNPDVNAVVSLDEERARAGAAAADERTASGESLGPLHGLPHAFKDTHEVAGWRTTFGSPLRADHVPKRDELIVERIRGAGAVVIGKTNVPEWAAGSHTFNPVFGATRNPYDLSRSAGGSTGGAGAALASGMIGGVGQRMLVGVSKRMAAEFFDNVDTLLASGDLAGAGARTDGDGATVAGSGGRRRTPDGVDAPAPSGRPPAPAPGAVFTAPESATGAGAGFGAGVAVGAAAALAGALVGAWIARRRQGGC